MTGKETLCPGCGLRLVSDRTGLDARYNASQACVGLFDQLMAFSLSPREYNSLHQVVVDAYAAQHYGPDTKPITITFALIGLYLVFERGYTGREAQLAHIRLGKKRREWPRFTAPPVRAALTVKDVTESGEANYREMIFKWGKSVWEMWLVAHGEVAALVDKYLKV